MPNWCRNTVSILGSNENVREVVEFLRSEETHFSLENILPTPPETLERKTEGKVMPDWYDWRVENWGTKWETDAPEPETDYNPPEAEEDDIGYAKAKYSFDTAWAPPEEAINTLAKRFPKVAIHLAYDEPGMDFGGVTFWLHGTVSERATFDSPSNIEYMMDCQTFFEFREIFI